MKNSINELLKKEAQAVLNIPVTDAFEKAVDTICSAKNIYNRYCLSFFKALCKKCVNHIFPPISINTSYKCILLISFRLMDFQPATLHFRILDNEQCFRF